MDSKKIEEMLDDYNYWLPLPENKKKERINVSKTIYLANPYGFSVQQKEQLLPELVTALENLGLEVWEPFARNNQVDFTKSGWEYKIGQDDVADVVDADGFFGVVNGTPPDEGVMVELGIAIGLGKPIFLFRDDFRKCCDGEEYPLNLMIFTGLPQKEWKDYYYTTIGMINSPDKALWKWVNGYLGEKT